MEAKIAQLWPEIAMFIATCVVMVLGLSRKAAVRSLCVPMCLIGLAVAAFLGATRIPSGVDAGTLPFAAIFVKPLIAGIGILLLFLMPGVADRDLEAQAQSGKRAFEPIRALRGEFYAFFMFSLTGAMLCASAGDLIFLFLALELTSLPTYVMVAMSTRRNRSLEAGVKYFFLGALGAAIFLYGFALLYGATGTTDLARIHRLFENMAVDTGRIGLMGMLGLILSIIGVLFKIAAVPMHFYTPDVYQGAASPVTAFLAFVPKTAGFVAIMSLVACAGWSFGIGPDGASLYGAGHSLPGELRVLLWSIAALTMTVGNVLALLQSSVKRMLAYSSIAHSGYMLVGVIAGPGRQSQDFGTNGLAAVFFYLLSYGVMTIGAFSVLSALEQRRNVADQSEETIDEVDQINELRGLWKSHPVLAAVLVISALGLLGLPPLVGFLGKLPLFTSALSAGETPLVIILGLNSAIAACYYLRLVSVPFLDKPEPISAGVIVRSPFYSRQIAGIAAAALVVVIGLGGGTWFGQRAVEAAGNVTYPMRKHTPNAAIESKVDLSRADR